MDRVRRKLRFDKRRKMRSGIRDAISYRRTRVANACIILVRIFYRNLIYANIYIIGFISAFRAKQPDELSFYALPCKLLFYSWHICLLHLAHRSLTTFRERDTYTRSDPIVMDCECNFSRDGQTDERKMHFQLFWKKEKFIVARFRGIFLAKYAAHAPICYRGDFVPVWLPALLGSCVEYRWLITGKSGHPRSLLFRGTFCTTASTLLFRSRASIAKAEPIASRMSHVRFAYDAFPSLFFHGCFARINERHFRGKAVYMAAIE